ncbi:hypothetical protein ADUPG1_000317 [Aduncisulcus paluster]|uniref:Bromo domain-containing protein n=1 Tax=Aduncisulcus paluster TaxID=2918883 RepID=A0ABQ5K5W8_9EUKA|nr:hypothetical protein ADUPG1_000317 [Aduncisulcus paluster]
MSNTRNRLIAAYILQELLPHRPNADQLFSVVSKSSKLKITKKQCEQYLREFTAESFATEIQRSKIISSLKEQMLKSISKQLKAQVMSPERILELGMKVDSLILQGYPIKAQVEMKNLMGYLMKGKIGHEFGVFVEPVTDVVAPGYSSIVKTPMSFQDIVRKLDADEYGFTVNFFADLMVVISNALHYNPPGTPVFQIAKKLKQVVMQKIQGMWLRLHSQADR